MVRYLSLKVIKFNRPSKTTFDLTFCFNSNLQNMPLKYATKTSRIMQPALHYLKEWLSINNR